MRTYISIDLDRWLPAWPVQTLTRVLATQADVAMAVDHHRLLPHINDHEFDTLVNIDCHSDLGGTFSPAHRRRPGHTPELACGNWADFVREDCRGEFRWVYARASCVTRCVCHTHTLPDPFCIRGDKLRMHYGWQRTRQRRSPVLLRDELATCVGIGICLSPEFLPRSVRERFTHEFERLATDLGVTITT